MDEQLGKDEPRAARPAAPPPADDAPRRRRGFHRRTPARAGRGSDARRAVDLQPILGVVAALPIDGGQADQRRRRLVAELCKVIGAHVAGGGANGRASVADGLNLAPRLRQTLEFLVAGDSERQIALKLNISQHTVHVYVKKLYKRFDVASRGELLARFVRGGAPGAD